MEWQLQDAKYLFSNVVQKARHEGPQIVTLCAKRAAVVLSAHDYDALRAGRPTLVDDLFGGPAWDDQLAHAVTGRDGWFAVTHGGRIGDGSSAEDIGRWNEDGASRYHGKPFDIRITIVDAHLYMDMSVRMYDGRRRRSGPSSTSVDRRNPRAA